MAKRKGCSPEFAKKVNRLIRVKVREIIDGCLACQGLATDRQGCGGCSTHSRLINDMVLHPMKYATELLNPGTEIPGDHK